MRCTNGSCPPTSPLLPVAQPETACARVALDDFGCKGTVAACPVPSASSIDVVAGLPSAAMSGDVCEATIDHPCAGSTGSTDVAGGDAVAINAECFRLQFEGIPLPMWICDTESGRVLAINDAAIDLISVMRDGFAADVLAQLATVAAESPHGDSGFCNMHSCKLERADGVTLYIDARAQDVCFLGQSARLVTAIDRTSTKRAERITEALILAFEILLHPEPPERILDRLGAVVDAALEGHTHCMVSLAIQDVLHVVHAPNVPREFVEAMHGSAIGPDSGSCSAAAWIGKAVFASDIGTDPLWNRYAVVALASELRASASFPMCGPDGATIGVFGVYFGSVRSVSPEERQFLALTARIAARAIEHHFGAHESPKPLILDTLHNDTPRIDRHLEEFGFAIAHELSAPLRLIEAMSRELAGNALTDSDRADCARRLNMSCQHLARLVDGMLALASSRHRAHERSLVCLSDLAYAVVNEFSDMEPTRRVDVIITPEIVVRADPVLMRVLMRNLMSNAWKYTRNSDSPRIEFDSLLHNGEHVFYVRDNGVGFDPACADGLLDSYTRLAGTRHFPGTGIGLVTARRIVESHGGRLWFDAMPGQGASFYFSVG